MGDGHEQGIEDRGMGKPAGYTLQLKRDLASPSYQYCVREFSQGRPREARHHDGARSRITSRAERGHRLLTRPTMADCETDIPGMKQAGSDMLHVNVRWSLGVYSDRAKAIASVLG
jgi:hypothetical protein